MKSAILSAALTTFLIATSPAAATVMTFEGGDAGVLGYSPVRPNADAAFDAFVSASGPLTVLDFEAPPTGRFLSLTSGQLGVPGVSIAPAAASDGDDTTIVTGISGNSTNTTRVIGADQFLLIHEIDPTGEPAVGVTINFSDTIFSFGAFLTGLEGGERGIVTVEFNDGLSQVITVAETVPGFGPGVSFLGFTTTTGTNSVSIILNPEFNLITEMFGIDDIAYSTTAVAVPEPATLALFGLGLAGIGFAARRKRKAA